VATVTWDGSANDGNWGTASNWDTGAAPVTGDDVVIKSTNQNITAGLNQTAVDLASLTITEGYTGSIGNAGSSLTISCSGTVTITAKGTIRLTAGSADITTLKVLAAGPEGFFLNGGTTTTVHSGPTGILNISADAVVTNYYGGGMTAIAGASGTAFTLVEIAAGSIYSDRTAATLRLLGDGCRAVIRRAAAISTAAYVGNGSTYQHNSSGTITLIWVYSGGVATAFDATSNFTVTNSNLFVNGELFKEPRVTVTYTNATSKYGHL
jgi:hypothetical protein